MSRTFDFFNEPTDKRARKQQNFRKFCRAGKNYPVYFFAVDLGVSLNDETSHAVTEQINRQFLIFLVQFINYFANVGNKDEKIIVGRHIAVILVCRYRPLMAALVMTVDDITVLREKSREFIVTLDMLGHAVNEQYHAFKKSPALVMPFKQFDSPLLRQV